MHICSSSIFDQMHGNFSIRSWHVCQRMPKHDVRNTWTSCQVNLTSFLPDSIINAMHPKPVRYMSMGYRMCGQAIQWDRAEIVRLVRKTQNGVPSSRKIFLTIYRQVSALLYVDPRRIYQRRYVIWLELGCSGSTCNRDIWEIIYDITLSCMPNKNKDHWTLDNIHA